MTIVLKPDYDSSIQDRMNAKLAVANILRGKAIPILNTSDLDIREPIVGGSAVTTTQTGLSPNQQGGSSTPAVDLTIEAIAATTIGWDEAAPTAYTLTNIVGTTQTVTTQGKVFAFYGLVDETSQGDLSVIRFKSGASNIKALIETQSMYESSLGMLIGGTFEDLATRDGDASAVFFGATQQQEPIQVAAIWKAAVEKLLKVKTLMAEVGGTVITGRAKTQTA